MVVGQHGFAGAEGGLASGGCSLIATESITVVCHRARSRFDRSSESWGAMQFGGGLGARVCQELVLNPEFE